jgi:hypothetical protein
MGERIIKTTVRVSLFLSIAYLLRGCYLEKWDIRIEPVSQPTTWVYDMFTPIIGERGYYVLIDGELDQDAGLETKHQVTTSRIRHRDTTVIGAGPYAGIYSIYPAPSYTSHVVQLPDSTYTLSYGLKLPKGKFSMYYNRDDSGAETFIYHPLKARKGWIRIQISPGVWN